MPCTLNNHLQQLWLEDWTQSRRESRVVRGHGTDRGGSQDIVTTLASVKVFLVNQKNAKERLQKLVIRVRATIQ
jgi:hypothetical protein